MTALGDRTAFFLEHRLYTLPSLMLIELDGVLDYFASDTEEGIDPTKEDTPTGATQIASEISGRPVSLSLSFCVPYPEFTFRTESLARSNLIPRVGRVFMAVFISRRME